MTKSEIRKLYKERRARFNVEEIDEASLKIANQLLSLDLWHKSFYHTFLTIKDQKEINTEYLLSILSGKDKNIVVSKSDFKDLSMKHYLLTDATKIKLNSYGIPEPVDGIEIKPDRIDVVFVPLLAFDVTGNRIGYGKGFYDRFLAQCRNDCSIIGLSLFEADNKLFVNQESTDIKLNYCICPDKIYKF